MPRPETARLLYPTARLSWWTGLGVVLITAIILSPVLQHEFVAWDDDVHVYENPNLHRVTWQSIGRFWTAPYAELYIPLTYTAWSALAWLSQMLRSGPVTPELFHGLNLALHLGSVAAVYRLGLLLAGPSISNRQMEMRRVTAAAFSALVFGLHPVQMEPVAWVSGLKDVLCGWCALLAVWQYLIYVQTPAGHWRRLHYGLATTAFVLALLAKPVAVVVPVITGSLAIMALGQSWKLTARSLALWMILTVLWGIVTKGQQPDALILYVTPWWGRLLIAMDSVSFYLGKLVWPAGLGPDYGRTPQVVLGNPWTYVTGLVPVGIGLFLWWGRRRWHPLRLASCIFVAGLLPVLGLVPFLFQGHSTVADRYMYLSLLGPALGGGWILQRGNRWKLSWVAGGLIIALLAWRSADQVLLWRDTVTLFTHTLQINPRSALAHNNLGLTLAKQGKLNEAIAHYERALHLKPEYAYTHNNLGRALVSRGQIEEAITHYTEALRLQPDYTNARNNLGLALLRQNKPDQAIEHFASILSSSPDAMAHNNLGIALAAQGNFVAAMAQFALALHLKPDYAKAYHNLGLAFARLERIDEAQAAFRTALQLQPDWSPAALSLTRLLAKLRPLSTEALHDAISLTTRVCNATGYRDPTALYALALLHQIAEQPAVARRTARQAHSLAVAANNTALAAEIRSHFLSALQREPIHVLQ